MILRRRLSGGLAFAGTVTGACGRRPALSAGAGGSPPWLRVGRLSVPSRVVVFARPGQCTPHEIGVGESEGDHLGEDWLRAYVEAAPASGRGLVRSEIALAQTGLTTLPNTLAASGT